MFIYILEKLAAFIEKRKTTIEELRNIADSIDSIEEDGNNKQMIGNGIQFVGAISIALPTSFTHVNGLVLKLASCLVCTVGTAIDFISSSNRDNEKSHLRMKALKAIEKDETEAKNLAEHLNESYTATDCKLSDVKLRANKGRKALHHDDQTKNPDADGADPQAAYCDKPLSPFSRSAVFSFIENKFRKGKTCLLVQDIRRKITVLQNELNYRMRQHSDLIEERKNEWKTKIIKMIVILNAITVLFLMFYVCLKI